MTRPRQPGFFIVGGPKCGTTALYTYLARHPQLYVPPAWLRPPGKSEPCHFATDLLSPADPWCSRDRYLSFFRDASDDQLCGDASVYHLVSELAAGNIHAFGPDAKIIMMIRNPVDVIPSLHAQMVYTGDEPLKDLGRALAAEAGRARGEGVPEEIRFPMLLQYRTVARFSPQIARYQACFPASNILIILFDDFLSRPGDVYRRTLTFLGVDPGRGATAFEVINPRTTVRSTTFQQLAKRPAPFVRRLARVLLPLSMRMRGRRWLYHLNRRFNTVPQSPEAVPAPILAGLQEDMTDEIQALGNLLDRDLSPWLT